MARQVLGLGRGLTHTGDRCPRALTYCGFTPCTQESFYQLTPPLCGTCMLEDAGGSEQVVIARNKNPVSTVMIMIALVASNANEDFAVEKQGIDGVM